MPFDRQRIPPPRERTFAELFPWRNVVRALMLVVLIFAIIAIKRSTGPLLGRVTDLWGQPATGQQRRDSARQGREEHKDQGPQSARRVRLGPGLAPASAQPVPGDGR